MRICCGKQRRFTIYIIDNLNTVGLILAMFPNKNDLYMKTIAKKDGGENLKGV